MAKPTRWPKPEMYVAPDGKAWDIKFVRRCQVGEDPAHANCVPEIQLIEVSLSADPNWPGTPPPSESQIAGSLLHELLHVVYPQADEPSIERTEYALSATIRRNKEVWHWILRHL